MSAGTIVGGRFQLVEPAGSGGMAVVWRGRDLRDDTPVAIKLLSPGAGADERFSRETGVLRSLSHPAVVRYLDAGATAEGTPFLVMEWLEGEDLASRLGRGPLTAAEAMIVAERAALGLGAAHARGIVHRDVKPANLYLSAGDVRLLKVIDFGLAVRHDSIRQLTRSGQIVGTIGYVAPEQIRERPVDPRTDLFALGCVLHECLLGGPAFGGGSVPAVLMRILLEDPPFLHEVVPEVPPALSALVAQLLAKDPSDRPAGAAAVVAALARISSRVRGAASPVSLGVVERRVSCVLVIRVEEGTPARHLLATASRIGTKVEEIPEGPWVLSFEATSSAQAVAEDAARAALWLRGALPTAPICLATGSTVADGRRALGDAVDRAVSLLPSIQEPGGPIRVDEVTARLLGDRFAVRTVEGVHHLEGSRGGRTDAPRLLGRTSPFLGREHELVRIGELFAEVVRDSVARALVVTAPAGTGKSRLLAEALDRIRQHPSRPAIGLAAGDPVSAGSPFGLATELIRTLTGVDASAPLVRQWQALRRVVEEHAPESMAGRVATFLAELLRARSDPPVDQALRAALADPVLMSDQIRRAVQDLVTGVSQIRPVVLVLDDLHWGDAPTVELVGRLLRNLADRPLLVIALARPEVATVFPSLWAGRAVALLELPGVPSSAARRLVRVMLRGAADDLTDRIVERAEGNAFHLEELIRAADHGQTRDLPETVLSTAQARLTRLDESARRLLRVASIFGGTFPRGGVRALLPDVDGSVVDAQLEELERRELVDRLASSRFRDEVAYRFRHGLLRDAAHAMLTEGDCRRGHLLAAEWLLGVGSDDALPLAEHLERAGAPERAAPWFLRAAEAAFRAHDVTAAIELCARADACGASALDLGALRYLQARLEYWSGDHAAACAFGREAVSLLCPGSALWYQAVAQWGADLGAADRTDELAALAESLVASTPDAQAVNDKITTILRVSSQLRIQGRAREADELFASVADSAARAAPTDTYLAAWLYDTRAYRAHCRGDTSQLIDECEAAAACFVEMGYLRTAANVQVDIAFGRSEIGLQVEAELELRRTLAIAEEIGITATSLLARQNLGLALGRMGRHAEARALLEAVAERFAERRSPRNEGVSRAYLAQSLLAQGELDGALDQARAAAELLRAGPALRPMAVATVAAVLLAQGHAAAALAVAREAIEALEALGAVEEGEWLVRLTWAEALEANGERLEARRVIEDAHARLLARADRITRQEWRESFLAMRESRRIVERARAALSP